MNSEQHVFDLLPAYALGSLDDEEKIIVEAHLPDCETCRLELETYSQIVDDLPLAVNTRQAPVGLKATIFDQLGQARQNEQGLTKDSWVELFKASLLNTAPVWGAVGLLLIIVLLISNLYLLNNLRAHETAQLTELTTMALVATDYSPNSTGMLVISRDGEYGVLVVD